MTCSAVGTWPGSSTRVRTGSQAGAAGGGATAGAADRRPATRATSRARATRRARRIPDLPRYGRPTGRRVERAFSHVTDRLGRPRSVARREPGGGVGGQHGDGRGADLEGGGEGARGARRGVCGRGGVGA